MTEKEATAALRRAAKKYEKAQAARDAAFTELGEAIRAADQAGVGRNEIQRQAGVARQTVWNALGHKQRPITAEDYRQ